MGCYINPKDTTKEQWLIENGVPVSVFPEWEDIREDGCLPVILVNNGPFTAAAIAYEKAELEYYLEPDPRPQTFYLVNENNLIEVEPSLKLLLEREQ